jgi:hypothetical protein
LKPWSPAKTNIAQPEKKTILWNKHSTGECSPWTRPLSWAREAFQTNMLLPNSLCGFCGAKDLLKLKWHLQAWPDLKNRTSERCQLIISPNVNVFLAGKTSPSNPHLPPGGLILVMSTSVILQPQCRQRHALQLHQFHSAPHISRGKSTQFSA